MAAAGSARQHGALGVALALVLVWGTNFSILKAVMTEISPAGFLFARYIVTPLCAVALLLWIYRLKWPRPNRAEWLGLAWLALLGHILHVGLMSWGIHLSTAFSSALILACGPMFTLILIAMLGAERLRRSQVLAVAVACTGILIFLWDKLGGGWNAGRGDLVLLGATVLFSAHTVAARKMIQAQGAALVMAYTTLLGTVPLLLATGRPGLAVHWSALPLSMWLSLAWALVVSSFTGWIVWGWVNRVRGVARSAPLLYLLPPIAGATAWWLAGETFTPLKIAGAAIALCGVAWAQLSGARQPAAPLS